MACGVPVVQPQNGVFPELLAAAAGGLLFEPGNVQSLQRQLERILTEPQLAATLANNGRVGVAELFTARRAAQTLQQLLRKLCGPNSSLE
jgi:glycosyltransferase involved in cell wall biosynthesis